jgi:hypothetical protein
MTTTEQDPRYAQLREEGYCLFENVLDAPMLDELRRVTDALLDAYAPEEAHKYRYQGSNIGIAYQHPVFPRLFTWPKALEALHTDRHHAGKRMSARDSRHALPSD